MFKVLNYTEVETALHRALKPLKINGDWYACEPETILHFVTEKFDVLAMDFPSPRVLLEKFLTA